MAKKPKEVRIYPTRREIPDSERLARALLRLVDRLSMRDKDRFVAEGERILKEIDAPTKPKGSAA